MRVTNGTVRAVAKKAAARAEKMLGREMTRELMEVAEQTLIELGHEAERRQRQRTFKRSLRTIATATAVMGAGAAAIIATRQAARRNH